MTVRSTAAAVDRVGAALGFAVRAAVKFTALGVVALLSAPILKPPVLDAGCRAPCDAAPGGGRLAPACRGRLGERCDADEQ